MVEKEIAFPVVITEDSIVCCSTLTQARIKVTVPMVLADQIVDELNFPIVLHRLEQGVLPL